MSSWFLYKAQAILGADFLQSELIHHKASLEALCMHFSQVQEFWNQSLSAYSPSDFSYLTITKAATY